MFSHSCLIIGCLLTSTNWGLLSYIFCFIMCHMFTIVDRYRLQASQLSTWTLLLQCHASVICAECGWAFSCLNKWGLPWKRWQHTICCSKTWIFFSIDGPLQMCRLGMSLQMLVFELIRSWMVPLLCSLADFLLWHSVFYLYCTVFQLFGKEYPSGHKYTFPHADSNQFSYFYIGQTWGQ